MLRSKTTALAALAVNALVSLVHASTTAFPGPWDSYIQAPDASRIVHTNNVFYIEGSVATRPNVTVLHGQGALVTFEFPQNTGGRLSFEIDPHTTSRNLSVGVSFTESPLFVGRLSDATTNPQFDMATFLPLREQVITFDKNHVRGAFKYVTFFVPAPGDPVEGQAYPVGTNSSDESPVHPIVNVPQQNTPFTPPSKPRVKHGSMNSTSQSIGIKDVWVNFTAFPSKEDPQEYTGYFSSSDNLLNRVWYAGAYTLQLSSIDPKEGGALINYNRFINNNTSPDGTWYNNFTIANGSSVTVDGAKRDRMVYAGDMMIALPGIAVSTYDLITTKNALQTLFAHHYHGEPADGGPGRIRLPYAGPPMGSVALQEFSDTYHMHALLGVYQYVLYSGDMDFLEDVWDLFVMALRYSLDKVLPDTGLMNVTSANDWLRPGMGLENIEANGILYKTLVSAIDLCNWLETAGFSYTDINGFDLPQLAQNYTDYTVGLRKGVQVPGRLWNDTVGLFCDNPTTRRDIFPQDGNSWALSSGLIPPTDPKAAIISKSLVDRWGPFGAPAVEAPDTISPFVGGFELVAHSFAGNISATLDLIRLQWRYMLDGPGFTNSTLIEGYDVNGGQDYPLYDNPARGSHAHGWAAGPTSSLMTEVLGIKLLEPEGKKWTIAPQPGDLTAVRGGFQTGLGKFEVVFESSDSGETLEIEAPPGSNGVLLWAGQTGGVQIKGGGRWSWTKGPNGTIKGGKVVQSGAGMTVQARLRQ